jgi:hypothetical protein
MRDQTRLAVAVGIALCVGILLVLGQAIFDIDIWIFRIVAPLLMVSGFLLGQYVLYRFFR